MNRSMLACATALAMLAAACASAPVAAPPKAAGPSFEQKMAWILRLEDQRVLRDPAPVVPPAAPAPARGQKAPAVVTPPPSPPDLTRLVADSEAESGGALLSRSVTQDCGRVFNRSSDSLATATPK